MRNTHVLSPLCLQNDKHTDIKIQHCLWMTLFPANFVHSISFIDKMLFLNFVFTVKFAMKSVMSLKMCPNNTQISIVCWNQRKGSQAFF